MADPTLALVREPAHLVSPRAQLVWAAHALATWALPLAGLVTWWWFDPGHARERGWALLAVGVAVAVQMLVMPVWRYRVHRWEANETAVFTRAGWINQERRIAPISRVQTVDLERGPLQQMLGLATVRVTTASAAATLRLHHLPLATAEDLVARLTTVTARTPGDAT